MDWGGEKIGRLYKSTRVGNRMTTWKKDEEEREAREAEHQVPLFVAGRLLIDDVAQRFDEEQVKDDLIKVIEHGGLTSGQLNFLRLYLQGYNFTEIGQQLGYTYQNAGQYFETVVKKLQKHFSVHITAGNR